MITKEPDEDVVLCDDCGTSLHDPENDIHWQDTQAHECKKMAVRSTALRMLEALSVPTDEQCYGKAHSLISYKNGYIRAMHDAKRAYDLEVMINGKAT